MDESVGCVNDCLRTSFDKRKCIGRNGNGANGILSVILSIFHYFGGYFRMRNF